MFAIEVHRMLTDLAKNTFPDKDIQKFFIEIHPKEMATFHGDYRPSDRKIRIFNLSRKTSYILKTTIHELAHHCEFCIYGNTGHSKRFYEVYHALLHKAIEMGLIDFNDIKDINDSRDIDMLIKYFGIPEVKYNPNLAYKKDKYIIKVINSYPIKDKLSQHKYKYNPIEQNWYKEIDKNNIEKEKRLLIDLTQESNIIIHEAKDLTFDAVYYIVVENGYEQRNLLKQRNYYFKGNVWVKKINAKELQKEEDFLSSYSFKYRIKGKAK